MARRPARARGPAAAPACPHPLGWFRVPAFTVPTVGLAVTAHVAAGGGPPDAGTLTVLLLCVGLVTASVAGRQRRMPHLLAGVALVQVAVHVALLDHHPGAPTRQHIGAAPMTLAHAGTSLALAWWLTKGESCLWRQVLRLSTRIERMLSLGPVDLHDRPGPSRGSVTAFSAVAGPAVPRLRGPPTSV